MNSQFSDIRSFTEGENRVFCYRSGTAVMEEVFCNGLYYSAGTNATGYPLNVLSNCNTRLNPHHFAEPFGFQVTVDGVNVCRNLNFLDFTVSQNGREAQVVFTDCTDTLTFVVHTVADGTGVFTRYLTVENRGERGVNLSGLVLHGGGLEKTDYDDVAYYDFLDGKGLYDLGYFDNDDWGREGEFAFHPLLPGTTCVDCKFGAGRFRHPAFFLRNNAKGTVFFVQCGWSGGVRFRFCNTAKTSAHSSCLSYQAELTGYAPLYILKPGETFTSPEVHIGLVHGDLDCAVNAGIRHMRQTVLPHGADTSVGGGMGAEHDMSVETSMAFATQLHHMGAEVFIIDAGWACPPEKESEWYRYNGINRIHAERYPNQGLARIREHCKAMGMQFGMWMEPERFGDKAGIREKHPDWMAGNIYGNKTEGFLDFTNPAVVDWAEKEISYVIEEYQLDLFRLDYNVDIAHCFGFNGEGECICLRHYSNLYAMFARLAAKYPRVVFENCAGGGGRTDLGFMKNFNHTWVSDNQKMPRSTEITNGMTMVLPPERVDRLFAGMGCHTVGDMISHLRNTMLTHMSLNVITPAVLPADPALLREIRSCVELYRQEIRPLIPKGLLYHHTPTRAEVEKQGYTCLELASEEGDLGFLTLFSPAFAGKRECVVKPKGIRKSWDYTVYSDNEKDSYRVSGRELADRGIVVRLNTSLTSELIKYKAIR